MLLPTAGGTIEVVLLSAAGGDVTFSAAGGAIEVALLSTTTGSVKVPLLSKEGIEVTVGSVLMALCAYKGTMRTRKRATADFISRFGEMQLCAPST